MLIANKKVTFVATVLSLLSSFGSAQTREPPEDDLRYIVHERVGKKTAMNLGGNVVLRVPDTQLYAMVFPDQASVDKMMDLSKEKGFLMELDQLRKPIEPVERKKLKAKKIDQLNQAEEIPYGIEKVFEGQGIPPANYWPDITHPICIIDSGYELDHPDLPDNAVAADPSQEDKYSFDGCGHGTHVAGTVGATGGNNQGVVGVFPGAPGMQIVKVFGGSGSGCGWSYSSGLIAAANHCRDKGAKIISMSLGGGGASNAEEQAFEALYNDHDILVIAAAGNGGCCSYMFPAAYPVIMSVGATDSNDNIASFSQKNDQVEISAPGVQVLSTLPNGTYGKYSGTSMACPHVSGVALVLRNKFPNYSAAEIRQALIDGVIDKGDPGKDNSYGYGLMNYWNSAATLNSEPTVSPKPTESPTDAPTAAPTMTAAPTATCEDFEFEIQTDNWPMDISWKLKATDDGSVLMSKDSAYYVGKGANKKDIVKECITPMCMKLHINDSWGDGLTGNGYFKVRWGGQEIMHLPPGSGGWDDKVTPEFGCKGAPTPNPPAPTTTPPAPTTTPPAPTTSPPGPTPPTGCPAGQSLLEVKYKSDNNLWLHNNWYQIVRQDAAGKWKVNVLKKKKQKLLPKGSLNVATLCVDDGVCYRFNAVDEGGDGICCDDGEGFYQISLGGELMEYSRFQQGQFRKIFFSDNDSDACDEDEE